MKINDSTISFQKRLVAKCQIPVSNGSSEECNIYEIEQNNLEDYDYFENIKSDSNWNFNNFLDVVNYDFKYGGTAGYFKNYAENRFFSIENQNGEKLAICEADFDYDPNTTSIENIETCPEYINFGKSKKSKYSHIGQTMVRFIAKLSKRERNNILRLTSIIQAKSFYQKLPFKNIDSSFYKAEGENFEELASDNSIEFIA